MRERSASFTAEVVALFRARHDILAASAIMSDPYAAWFLGRLTRPVLDLLTARPNPRARWFDALSLGLCQFTVLRHHHFDRALLDALAQGVGQIVILGAGYDMRAYRFADRLGSATLFEVDHPATAERKQRVLARHGVTTSPPTLRHLSIDFNRQRLETVLVDGGFDPTAASLFIWEGVTMYLDRDAVAGTLGTLAALSPPGSKLVFDFVGRRGGKGLLNWFHDYSPTLMRTIGEPITWRTTTPELHDLLGSSGFELRDVLDLPALGRHYAPTLSTPTLFDCFVASAHRLGD